MLARKRNMMSLVGLLTVCLTGVIVKLQRSHRLVRQPGPTHRIEFSVPGTVGASNGRTPTSDGLLK